MRELTTDASKGDPLAVAKRIRFLRQKTGMTQDEFAQKVGVSRSYLSEVENLRTKPSIDLIFKVIEQFSESHQEATTATLLYGPDKDGSKYDPHKYIVRHIDAGCIECSVRFADQYDRASQRSLSSVVKTALIIDLMSTYERTILSLMEQGKSEFESRRAAEASCAALIDNFGPGESP